MEKLTKKEFIISTVLIASVYSGLIYNFFTMSIKSQLKGNLSIFMSGRSLANIIGLTFIVFTLILILSIKYTEKINQNFIVYPVLIFVGFSYLVVAGLWTLELFILEFIVVGLAIAYLTPILARLSSELVGPNPRKNYYKMVYPLSIFLWMVITGAIFYITKDETLWRMFYIITGCLNISGALLLSNPR